MNRVDVLRFDALDLTMIVRAALRRRRWVGGAVVLFVATATVFTFARQRTYTASAGLRPTTTGGSNPSAVAPVLGLGALSVSLAWPELDYYIDLVESRATLREVVRARYVIEGSVDSVSLMETLGLAFSSSDAILGEQALEWLRDAITIRADPRTQIMRIFVRTPSRMLSVQVLDRIVQELHRVDESLRHTEAEQERSFVAAQRAGVQEELRRAEDALAAFRAHNRVTSGSASLRLQEDRFLADIGRLQTRFIELEQREFQARLRATRSTPSFTLLEVPLVPAAADSRRLFTNVSFAAITGLLIGLYAAFWRERLSVHSGASDS